MKRRNLLFIAAEAVLNGVLLYFLVQVLSLNRTGLIIRMDVVRADRYILTCWCAWGAAALIGNMLLLLLRRRVIRARRTIATQLTFSPDKRQDPAAIRSELERFRAARPLLESLFQQGLEQLDSIDRKEEKMAEILARNELSLLSDASNALSDAEQTICRKLVLVLNRAILCDPMETNKTRKESVYSENVKFIQTFLDENEDVLNRCEQLLSETVYYVEQKKAGKENVDLQLMTGVIRSLSGDGIRMGH